ncbi:zona pellucida sperm-binding protein 4-like [Triplophysa dalaica]|uniref:zona pellucida sperm-binding protein 4-like n=1 Tax=Triplophysa dalaica TaxID=1582913 RepID=UPI0024DF7F6E|nr:zona pellucida sperm-binding protein 4-like [Triplophysa dalaica]
MSVTVQCIRDGQFVLVVARDVTLPRLSLDTVRLLGGNEASCGPVGSTPSFAIYQFPVTACGTSMTEENGYEVYENSLFLVRSIFTVGLRCATLLLVPASRAVPGKGELLLEKGVKKL